MEISLNLAFVETGFGQPGCSDLIPAAEKQRLAVERPCQQGLACVIHYKEAAMLRLETNHASNGKGDESASWTCVCLG
jgi:hypothetical protein